jgi:hypothetical protein
VGVFKESVDTFGQSEIQEDTMLIPYTVSRFFKPTSAVNEIYFSVATAQDVLPATVAIKRVLQSRHRSESVYSVQNLNQILTVAGKIADAMTLILMLVSFVTLLVSGIGIMNIMLATVTSRIREIGIRKAIGATNRAIRFQFLAEAILISMIGGIAGIVAGLASLTRCDSLPTTAYRSRAGRRSLPLWCRRSSGSSSGPCRPTAPRCLIRSKACATSNLGALRVKITQCSCRNIVMDKCVCTVMYFIV